MESIRDALKQINEVDNSLKLSGLSSLDLILREGDPRIKVQGYDQVIFKELIRLLQFEDGTVLEKALSIVSSYYQPMKEYFDEIAETLIYRVARSNDQNVCDLCLRAVLLLDMDDDRIAKHSKQLLKLSDLNDMTDLNPLYISILERLGNKLPKRRINSDN